MKRGFIMKIITWLKKQKEKLVAAATMSIMTVGMAVTTFAAESDNVAITSDMLEPILSAAKDNIAVILPVGIGLFAILLGVSFIPMLFKKFKKG
jgi:hypothetical protein